MVIRDWGTGKLQTCKLANWPAVACCSLFALCLLWRPLFAGEAFYWGAPLLQFIPWQRFAAEMWRSGHVPLWNPLVGCGAPLAANYQSAVFYPLNALYLLLPAEMALGWTVALHLALAGVGMYAWGRAVGLERFPALIAGLALEGSGFLVARAALFPSIALTFPWVAVWLWRGEMLVQRCRLQDALWLGLALGMGLLAGHAQTAFYGGLLLAAYCVFRVACSVSRNWRPFIVHCSLFIVSLLIGVGLAAVQLLLTAELMLQSQRASGVDYDFAMTYSFWPWRLFTFLAPDFFGNPGRGDYWGYATYWEDAGYVGVLPLLLAVWAVVRKGRGAGERRSRGARAQVGFWAGCVVAGLVLALGKNTPLFSFLFRHIPTFDLFQAPARWLAVTTVALAALAGIGAQVWPVGRAGQRQGTLWLVIGVALAVGGWAAPHLIAGERLATFGAATLRFGVTLAVAGALVLWRTSTRLQPNATNIPSGQCVGQAFQPVGVGEAFQPVGSLERLPHTRFAPVEKPPTRQRTRKASAMGLRPAWVRVVLLWQVAVLICVGLDLLLFGWPLVPSVDRTLYQGNAHAVLSQLRNGRIYWPTDPAHPGSEYDAEYRLKFGYLTFRSFGPRDVAYWRGMREMLIPNIGMLDGIATANDFDPLLVSRYAEMMAAIPASPNLLRVMGVTHIASDRTRPTGEPVYTSTDITLYHLSNALGRAWIVPAARQVPADQMLAALTSPTFDPATHVLIEASPPYPNPYSLIPNPYTLSLHDTPNGVTIRAALDAPGYLVLADTWYPGWQAKVDGKPVEILRANHAFRAVYLDAGGHTVEMVYRPWSFIAGMGVSGMMGAGWLVSWLVGRLRRRGA